MCSIPIGFRIWIEGSGNPTSEVEVLGEVQPFIFETHKDGEIFTEVQFYDRLNILLISNCELNCSQVVSAASGLDNWTKKALTYEGQETKLFSLSLLAASETVLNSTSKSWRKIHLKEGEDLKESQKLLPSAQNLNKDKTFLVFVTGDLQIVHAIAIQDMVFNDIEKILSKLSFNTYLQKYLSERTFMGPKRKVSRF